MRLRVALARSGWWHSTDPIIKALRGTLLTLRPAIVELHLIVTVRHDEQATSDAFTTAVVPVADDPILGSILRSFAGAPGNWQGAAEHLDASKPPVQG